MAVAVAYTHTHREITHPHTAVGDLQLCQLEIGGKVNMPHATLCELCRLFCCLSLYLTVSLLLISFLCFLYSLQLLSWQHMPRRSARQPALDRKVSRDVPHAACHAIDATQSLMTCRMGFGLARWHQLSGRG